MALRGNSTGNGNTAVGDDALRSPVQQHRQRQHSRGSACALLVRAHCEGPGDNNTAIGVDAGA